MKERNGQPNAIFEGEKLSASLSASLADPQSAKQTNVILMKERNGQPNAIFEGEKLSVSLSVSLADPQSAKQTNAILVNERKKWTAKCNI
jgi:hypothetical protein